MVDSVIKLVYAVNKPVDSVIKLVYAVDKPGLFTGLTDKIGFISNKPVGKRRVVGLVYVHFFHKLIFGISYFIWVIFPRMVGETSVHLFVPLKSIVNHPD